MLKKLFFLIALYAVSGRPAFSQKPADGDLISEFVREVKKNEIDRIARHVAYPLYRKYPLPPVRTEKEFITRYARIFDDSLKQLITESDRQQDWQKVGWRGTMLRNGILWLDTDGKLKQVNYESASEEHEWRRLVQSEKAKLYPDLRLFSSPVLFMTTRNFKVRIDQLNDGAYRYASWDASKNQSDRPDLVLTQGHYIADGSGGNHAYVFRHGDYSYSCYIAGIGAAGSPGARLIVSRDKKELLNEPARKRQGP